MTIVDPLKTVGVIATYAQAVAFQQLHKTHKAAGTTPTEEENANVFGLVGKKLPLSVEQIADLLTASQKAQTDFEQVAIFRDTQPQPPPVAPAPPETPAPAAAAPAPPGGPPAGSKVSLPTVSTPAGSAKEIELTDAQATATGLQKDTDKKEGKFTFRLREDGTKKYLSVTPDSDAEVKAHDVTLGNSQIKVTVENAQPSWYNPDSTLGKVFWGAVLFILGGIGTWFATKES